MTPESVLLALIAALLLAVVWFVYRLTNSSGTVSWSIKTTAPDEPWAIKFSEVEREEAMRRYARERALVPEPGPEEP